MIFEMGRRFVHRLSHECYTQGFNEKFTSSNPIRSHASVKQCRGFLEFPVKKRCTGTRFSIICGSKGWRGSIFQKKCYETFE